METEYLTFVQAKNFIDQCEKNEIFIYGIERFICQNGFNMPDLDGIADFSSLNVEQVSKAISSSQYFLSLFGKIEDERFTIVCD
jgi:allophanate hydrolase subunit 1